jgi:hypothetical protein
MFNLVKTAVNGMAEIDTHGEGFYAVIEVWLFISLLHYLSLANLNDKRW